MLATCEIVIDRPKGTAHPRFPEVVYPLDYGFLSGTSAGDGHEIDVWRGSDASTGLVGIICTADSFKKDAEIKLLVGCTPNDVDVVREFHRGAFMSGIVIPRDAASEAVARELVNDETGEPSA